MEKEATLRVSFKEGVTYDVSALGPLNKRLGSRKFWNIPGNEIKRILVCN